MAVFEVPWAINHSEHSARLARVAHQQNVGTGSGVSRPADLKVVPLETPGNGFRVMPGGGSAQSRDTDFSARESYAPLVNEVVTVSPVTGTGSGETRRDLIILEITDPEMESVTYPAPADAEYTGGWQDGSNFCRVTVIPGVASGVTSLDQITTGAYAHVTGVTLAAINWPANTATVTAGMIEDLRKLQSPRTERLLRTRPFSGSEEDVLTNTTTAGQNFPAVGADLWGALNIPDWATGARCIIWIIGMLGSNDQSYGDIWLEIGTGGTVKVESSRFDFPAGAGVNRATYGASGEVAIPAELRGTAQRFFPKARKNPASASTSKVSVDANSSPGA